MKLEFDEAYKKLNKAQKEAVDSIDGPVMVIAGPGTGKTQVLTLRIANILQKTDTPADGILCLTFTNSGVRAMRERLLRLIGPDGSRVKISTFHSFASGVLDEFYEALGLSQPPKLIDERDAVILIDELLEGNDWEYLRPRFGGANNFKDLKSLISLAKRERMAPQDLLESIDQEIESIKTNPEHISSRGATKGELKKETVEKIIRLQRTKEAASFYGLYEKTKTERGLADYDDILEYLVRLVQISSDAKDSIRERYLYVLVDEHQDSSGVQNEFLAEVWGSVERPNVFVVGDDRQLIYGFGGASLSHFENFGNTFEGAKIIPLVENYRSTAAILTTADHILESSIVTSKLQSQSKEHHPIELVEAAFPRDEILAAGLAIKKKIEDGVAPEQCVLLVPKNAQVRSAIPILLDLGLPVAAGNNKHFFLASETQSLVKLLRVIIAPFNADAVAAVLLDPISGVPVMMAHKFLKEHGNKISIEKFTQSEGEIKIFGDVLLELIGDKRDLYSFIQVLGEKFFFNHASTTETLLQKIEIVRTLLHIALAQMEKDPEISLVEFVTFIDRLESYGQDIPLAVFSATSGVRVMTLHASKGLEFDFVWIAHVDEASLMKGKQMGFTLPEKLSEKVSKKDELTARRELYVALTRAKRFATFSYAVSGYTGGDQELAKIIAMLPEELLQKTTVQETEKEILGHDPKAYVASEPILEEKNAIEEVQQLVRSEAFPMKLAVTHLNNFFSCPWMWYFRNFLRLPEAKSESLDFGNLIHACLNHYFKKPSVADDIPALIDQEIERMKLFDERVIARFKKDAVTWLPQLLLVEYKNFSEHTRTEVSLVYQDSELTNIVITGKIDLVELLDDETLQVTDFKTGRAYSKRDIEKRDEEGRLGDKLRQLAMYAYLISHQKDEKVISNSRLVFIESVANDKNRFYETQITNTEIELLKKDIYDFVEALESGEWVNRPCYNKKFGQKDCEYCKLRELIK
jgi:DNA helicase-2/ATP-dependent DNA helicase PcrA